MNNVQPKTIFHKRRNQKFQRGISLIELLIAISLGLFLSWGAVQAFLSGKQAYSLQQSTSRIQENGRMAQEFIGVDVRNSGDYGCGSGDGFITNGEADDLSAACTGINRVNVLNSAGIANVLYNFNYAVYGYNNVNDADISGTLNFLNPKPIVGTDILVTHPVEDIGALTAATTATDTALGIAPVDTLKSGEFIAVSDCASARIMRVDTITALTAPAIGSSVSIPKDTAAGANRCDLGAAIEKGASVRRIDTVIYYIAQGVSGRNELYRYSLNTNGVGGASDALLQGVDNLQLSFGLDTNGSSKINDYLDAGQITAADWNGWDTGATVNNNTRDPSRLVRAVSYSLLMSGGDSVLSEPQELTFNDEKYTGGVPPEKNYAPDLRLRQVFSAKIGIRTRVNPG